MSTEQQSSYKAPLSVDTKLKAPETQQGLKSASTALTTQSQQSGTIPAGLEARAIARAHEYLYGTVPVQETRYLQSRPATVETVYRSAVASPTVYQTVPTVHAVSAGYVQYQPPSYEVIETHTAHREREVTVEVPQYRTYVHYQPEAYEVTETHTATREKEVTVEVPTYTTYHTYKPEAYEVTETHTAVREKEVTVEVPNYKEYTYCTPGTVETVYDYVAPKEHVVYTPVQSVRYRQVTGVNDSAHLRTSSVVTSPLYVSQYQSVKSSPVRVENVKSSVSKETYAPVVTVAGRNVPYYLSSPYTSSASLYGEKPKTSTTQADKCKDCGSAKQTTTK